MSLATESPILFRGKVATTTTFYVPVPVRDGTIGAQLGWLDAVSSATFTLELSSFEGATKTSAGTAWEWKDSGLTIAGPAASAAGSTLVNVENVRQKSARFKVVTAAVSEFDFRDGTA